MTDQVTRSTISSARRALEGQVGRALRDFERETGCYLRTVRVDRIAGAIAGVSCGVLVDPPRRRVR